MASGSKSIHDAIGEMVITGFDGKTASRSIIDAFKRHRLGGYVVMGRNVGSVDQIFHFNRTMAKAVDKPLIVAVDQEGGKVQRLGPPFTQLPPMGRVGITEAPSVARQVGEILALELGVLGFTCDFAPVIDVLTVARNPALGARAFSASPSVVASMGAAFVEGMQDNGIIACGKHFPGHGATTVDSHVDLPVVSLDRDGLEPHLLPFVKAFEAGLGMVMTAHVKVPALDAERPATMSRAIIDKLLRRTMGFEGVVVTDDLGMGAVRKGRSLEDVVLDLLKVDVDIFLVTEGLEAGLAVVETIRKALKANVVSEERIVRSAERVRALKRARSKALTATSLEEMYEVVGHPDHVRFAESVTF